MSMYLYYIKTQTNISSLQILSLFVWEYLALILIHSFVYLWYVCLVHTKVMLRICPSRVLKIMMSGIEPEPPAYKVYAQPIDLFLHLKKVVCRNIELLVDTFYFSFFHSITSLSIVFVQLI